MSVGFTRRLRSSVAVTAALVLVGLASAGEGRGANLVANPALTRELPPPGWLSGHREEWVRDHAAYQATCRNAQVNEEIQLVNRAIAYDEYLLGLTSKSELLDSAVAKQAQLARDNLHALRADIVVADGLVARLQALPACAGEAATATAPPVAASPAAKPPLPAVSGPASPPPAAPQPPPAAVAAATAPAPAAAPEPGSPAATTARPVAAATPAPRPPQSLAISFDDRVAALTPAGIRAFREALEALRGGKQVKLAIAGCDADADFSSGSPCARRLLSLKALLAENGIRDPAVIAPPAAASPAATPSPDASETPPSGAPQPRSPDPATARPAAAAAPAPSAPQRLVISFDKRAAALTPAGVRTLHDALQALRSGKHVQLAIGGCGAGADFSNGSPCSRRLASLEALLADDGIRDPQRLFAGLR